MSGPELTLGMGIVFGLAALAALFFATGWLPVEITALAVAVLLALASPWTGVSPADAISGFSSPATVTVLAMFILSEGIRRTGAVDHIGEWLLRITGASERGRIAALVGLGGPAAGFVNNTPLVAVLVPALTDLARRTRTSPSRLLIPLSYAAMLGGTLTVIGTSTNLVASDLSGRLLGRPIGVFEITSVGIVILGVGFLYLITLGRRLVPERIAPEIDLVDRYRMKSFLAVLEVPEGSGLVGREIGQTEREGDYDLDVLRIHRGPKSYFGLTKDRAFRAGDTLLVRADAATVDAFARTWGLVRRPTPELDDGDLLGPNHPLLEATVPPGSSLVGGTVVTTEFRSRHHGTVLAIRRGDQVIRDDLAGHDLREGDALLVLVRREQLSALDRSRELEITGFSPEYPASGRSGKTDEELAARRSMTPTALAILAAVVGTAAAGLVPIYVAALGGVVLMVATGCLRVPDAYGAVDWQVVFLLAGILPLGIAMARTGAADYLAHLLVNLAGGLSPLAVLTLFYLLTALFANLISNNATVVLMIPVAVDAAVRVGADPFIFVLAVMFASSAGFMSPVGYQTNLMVYTPGGYRFTDFARVGAPLQLLLAIATPLALSWIWGV
jgi:di/tricarboxylate transporter